MHEICLVVASSSNVRISFRWSNISGETSASISRRSSNLFSRRSLSFVDESMHSVELFIICSARTLAFARKFALISFVTSCEFNVSISAFAAIELKANNS